MNFAARLEGMAHGGQVVVSGTVYEATRSPAHDAQFDCLGRFPLKGIDGEQEIYEMTIPSLPRKFPPINTQMTGLSEALSKGEGDASCGGACENCSRWLACRRCKRPSPGSPKLSPSSRRGQYLHRRVEVSAVRGPRNDQDADLVVGPVADDDLGP